jgi:hypothetical protein
MDLSYLLGPDSEAICCGRIRFWWDFGSIYAHQLGWGRELLELGWPGRRPVHGQLVLSTHASQPTQNSGIPSSVPKLGCFRFPCPI